VAEEEPREQTLPVAIADQLPSVRYDAETLWELQRAREVGSKNDPWLLASGLGGFFGGLIWAANAANGAVVGLAVSGLAIATLVVGKVAQKLASKKRQLDLGFDAEEVRRIEAVLARVDEEMGTRAWTHPGERIERAAELLGED
jgi:hypothetical protein